MRFNRAGQDGAKVEALTEGLRRAFDDHSVVVVPGFFATLTSGTLVSLGRGGSDLSAVLLAHEFENQRCELIKDVPGYFTDDPHRNARAGRLSRISYSTAMDMAERGCELVQRVALEAAREHGLELMVRSLRDLGPGTVVSSHANELGPRAGKPFWPR
jgi:aspartate kinase